MSAVNFVVINLEEQIQQSNDKNQAKSIVRSYLLRVPKTLSHHTLSAHLTLTSIQDSPSSYFLHLIAFVLL